MINEIVDGISTAIYNAFGEVPIYSEEVEQGFEDGSFFIVTLDASESRMLGNRAIRNNPFDVMYFPQGKKRNFDLRETSSVLYKALRDIELPDGSRLNGLKMHDKIEDGILHFFVEYKAVIYYPKDEIVELQGNMKSSVGVNDGK